MENSNPQGETVFTKILRREIPAQIVYEDEHTLAFLDAHPNHPGHTLVIPKKFARNIFDMDEQTAMHLFATVRKIAPAIRKGVSADGVNIAMNNEPGAGQVVFHAHIHVIPRYANDGFTFFPKSEYKPGEAAEVARRIQAEIENI